MIALGANDLPPGVCRAATCRRPLLWALTAANGRRIPLDPDPGVAGNIRLTGKTAFVLGGDDLAAAHAAGEMLYTSHFATCPGRQGRRGRR